MTPMGFWFFMLWSILLIPLLMIGFGSYFSRKVLKNKNGFLGYRTKMSMKNMKTWAFAHQYIGKTWLKVGLLLFPASAVAMFFTFGKEIGETCWFCLTLLLIQLLFLTGAILPVERALKKNFDENGNKRTD